MIPLEGTGPLGPLLPDNPSEFIVGIVLFFIILGVVWKKVVPTFEATYTVRADAIRGGIERAREGPGRGTRSARAVPLAALHGQGRSVEDPRGSEERRRSDPG